MLVVTVFDPVCESCKKKRATRSCTKGAKKWISCSSCANADMRKDAKEEATARKLKNDE